MGAYVLMIKLEDNDEKVIYKFGPNEKYMGVIEFDKIRREFNIVDSVDDGVLSNKAYERWAAEKIAKLMYKEDGKFPEITAVEK